MEELRLRVCRVFFLFSSIVWVFSFSSRSGYSASRAGKNHGYDVHSVVVFVFVVLALNQNPWH